MAGVDSALVALLVAATVPAIIGASVIAMLKEFIGGSNPTDD